MRTVLIILTLTLVHADRVVGADASAGPVVLVTAFHPFAQRQKNGSATLAESLPKALSDMRVHSEVMQVKWAEPQNILPALVARWRPRLLLGLGEGSSDTVTVENLAHNHAAGLDEAKRPPPFGWLQADGPRSRRATMEFDPKWALGHTIVTSDHAGSFLCNALFYVALAQPVERIGFIHLPPQNDEADALYVARLLPIIAQIARRNLGLPAGAP